MRLLKYLALVLLGLAIVTVAVANRDPVVVNALPPDMALFTGLGWSAQLPLFLVIFGGIAIGLLVGFFWEWARESRHRTVAERSRARSRGWSGNSPVCAPRSPSRMMTSWP